MASGWLKFLVPFSFTLAAGYGTYSYFEGQKAIKEMQVSCLSSVIPSVVVHHQHSEIVSLLQDLAKETGETSKVEKASGGAFFSEAIDKQLLKISDLFLKKKKNLPLGETEVAKSIEKAVAVMKHENNAFLDACMKVMRTAHRKCGRWKEADPSSRTCYQNFNQSIEDLIPKSS